MPIVAAVDRSEQATDIVEEANDLAIAFDETVHVVHVMTQSEFVDIAQSNVDDTGTAPDMNDVRTAAAEVAAEAIDEIEVPVETIGLVGEPAAQIIDYASKNDARYVVTGTRKRSPTGKAIFGSTSQSIILNADCSVVISIE